MGLLAVGLSACNVPGSLSESSSCADFNKASADDEQRIVVEMYHKAHPSEPRTGPGAANAVMNVSYECTSSPSRKLGDLGDFKGF